MTFQNFNFAQSVVQRTGNMFVRDKLGRRCSLPETLHFYVMLWWNRTYDHHLNIWSNFSNGSIEYSIEHVMQVS